MKIYLIKKDGKYLSKLYPITFGEDKPVAGKIYWYQSHLIAGNVAKQLGALVIEATVIGNGNIQPSMRNQTV